MRASGYARAAEDWYVEPRHTVDALLGVERFNGTIWDPCCGGGNIPTACEAAGYGHVISSDIADRGYGRTGQNFFDAQGLSDNIVSNPPYGLIEQFVRHALALTSGKTCVLARLAFLEGRDRAQNFWPTVPLARVWVSSRRLSMPPGGTDVQAKGGSVAFAWFVFEHGHSGPPALGWLP